MSEQSTTNFDSESKATVDSGGAGEEPVKEYADEVTVISGPPAAPAAPPKRKWYECCKCCIKKEQPKRESFGNDEDDRESWGSKVTYLLTLIGYAVGFGNIWRFPYLMHANGGVAFLIPYFTMLFLAGIPLFFMELAIGQRLGKGALGCWNEISPYLGGVGITCAVVCYFCVLYYNTLLAWVISYIVDSFRSELPWKSCAYQYNLTRESLLKNQIMNDTFYHPVPKECYLAKQPSKYYWYRRTLDISDSISDPGHFNPYMFLYLSIAWLVVGLILCKGIKSSGKVVYFTALFPYVTLFIFFISGFFQKGWLNGYLILLKPDFEKLIEPQTWLIAGTQIFFSLGLAFGVLIVFASHLPAKNNCYKDAVSVSLINCATSLFASIVIFPVLGSQGTRAYDECVLFRKFEFLEMEGMLFGPDFGKGEEYITNFAKNFFHIPASGGVGANVNDNQINNGSIYLYYARDTVSAPWYEVIVAEGHHPNTACNLEQEVRQGGSGTGLVFIAFAEAAKNLPVPQLFCFLFFMMLFTLGVDSSFATVEGAMAAIIDLNLVKWPRWVITVLTCGSLWLLSLVFCWGWGQYVQVFLDQFVANWSLIIIAFIETVGIAYVYGLAKFSYDIKLMTGNKPNLYMMICWKFVTPFILVAILIGSIVSESIQGYSYNQYSSKLGQVNSVQLPWWLLLMGFFFLFLIVMWIPLQAILWRFKISLLKQETPKFFPEEELRQERNLIDEDDIGEFDNLDKLVMGASLLSLQEERKSGTMGSIPDLSGADAARTDSKEDEASLRPTPSNQMEV